MGQLDRNELIERLPPRYRVERVLGQSSTGLTLEVFDRSLRQATAVLKLQRLMDDDVDGFREFASRLTSAAHPILGVPYTSGVVREARVLYGYTTREFIPGAPLSQLPLPLDTQAALVLASQLANGLAELHARRLMHGDLKPENIIVRRARSGEIDEISQCVLIDLSYRRHQPGLLSDVSVQYVPPELASGHAGDERTDLYALGVVLYVALTGSLPFSGASIAQVLRRQRACDFRPISSYEIDTPRKLEALVERLMDPHPENRPSSAEEVTAALASLVGQFGDVHGAQGAVGLIGREPALAACVERLNEAPHGLTMRVHGGPKMGVSSFLREAQDRLEAAGVVVLSARPRMASGRSLQEQLYADVHRLVRLAIKRDTGVPARQASNTTDLLDDLLVASQVYRIAVFVDDWQEIDVDEAHFLRRLQRQGEVGEDPVDSLPCHIVLGGRDVIESQTPASDLSVDESVTLWPLTAEDVDKLVASAGTSALPSTAISRIVRATGGRPAAVAECLRWLERTTRVESDAIDRALRRAQQLVSRIDSAEVEKILAHPAADALCAAVLWGTRLPEPYWLALLGALHPEGVFLEVPGSLLEHGLADGTRFYQARHVHLAGAIVRALPESRLETIVEAVLEYVCDRRDQDVGRAADAMRFLARAGWIPSRSRWTAVRYCLLMARAGRLTELEHAANCLASRASKWIAVLGERARLERGRSGSGRSTPNAGVEQVVRMWIEGRALWRRRQKREALRRLITCVRCGAHPPGLVHLLEDAAVLSAELCLHRAKEVFLARLLSLVRGIRAARVGARVGTRGVLARVRHRIAVAAGRFDVAAAAARRDVTASRAAGLLPRSAAALNNEGVALLRAARHDQAVRAFEECVALREDLDDERGVVVALNNLAVASLSTLEVGRAIAALNRARTLALRNGLLGHATASILNIGLAHTRIGQFTEARRIFRLVRARREEDTDSWSLATFNLAQVAVDLCHFKAAERFVQQLPRVAVSTAVHASSWQLRAEIAYRTRSSEALSQLIDRVPPSARVFYEYALDELRGLASHVRSDRGEDRLRVLRVRWQAGARRLTPSSLKRVLSACRRRGAIRTAHEWIVAYALQVSVRSDGAGVVARLLSRSEYREGHDDLRVQALAGVAAGYLQDGRDREAWIAIQGAVQAFARLERKCQRGESRRELLRHVGEAVRATLRRYSHGAASGLPDTASLSAEAFMAMRGRGLTGATSSARGVLGALRQASGGESALDRLLQLTVRETGAQRAFLIHKSEPGAVIARSAVASGAESEVDGLSWTVVSTVLQNGQVVRYDDALTSDQLASHRSVAELNLRSLACVPMPGGDGALYVDHQGIAGLFGEEDVEFLELVAHLIELTDELGDAQRRAERATRSLEEVQAYLVRAERTRLTGELLSGVAHDLKNVLAAVGARSQLLRKVSTDDNVVRSLKSIDNATTAGVSLIEKLQQCARDPEAQEPEVVDLTRVVRETVDILEPQFAARPNGVRVHLRLDGGALVLATPGEIREIVLNLCMNACDAMTDGGDLTVSVDTNDSHVNLRVMDSGSGVPAHVQARLFEPFFTTKGRAGTGLGLAIVRSAVIRRAGRVSIERTGSAGTTFLVALPLLTPTTYESD